MHWHDSDWPLVELCLSCIFTPASNLTDQIPAGYGYITRRADSEGVALGALSLPWAWAGLILMGWRYAVETGRRPGTFAAGICFGSHGGHVTHVLGISLVAPWMLAFDQNGSCCVAACRLCSFCTKSQHSRVHGNSEFPCLACCHIRQAPQPACSQRLRAHGASANIHHQQQVG